LIKKKTVEADKKGLVFFNGWVANLKKQKNKEEEKKRKGNKIRPRRGHKEILNGTKTKVFPQTKGPAGMERSLSVAKQRKKEKSRKI